MKAIKKAITIIKEKIKLTATSKAASMTEYMLILVLVAVAAIGVMRVFGKQVRHVYCKAYEALGGEYGNCISKEPNRLGVGEAGEKANDPF